MRWATENFGSRRFSAETHCCQPSPTCSTPSFSSHLTPPPSAAKRASSFGDLPRAAFPGSPCRRQRQSCRRSELYDALERAFPDTGARLSRAREAHSSPSSAAPRSLRHARDVDSRSTALRNRISPRLESPWITLGRAARITDFAAGAIGAPAAAPAAATRKGCSITNVAARASAHAAVRCSRADQLRALVGRRFRRTDRTSPGPSPRSTSDHWPDPSPPVGREGPSARRRVPMRHR
jgi:hypothetical protein